MGLIILRILIRPSCMILNKNITAAYCIIKNNKLYSKNEKIKKGHYRIAYILRLNSKNFLEETLVPSLLM